MIYQLHPNTSTPFQLSTNTHVLIFLNKHVLAFSDIDTWLIMVQNIFIVAPWVLQAVSDGSKACSQSRQRKPWCPKGTHRDEGLCKAFVGKWSVEFESNLLLNVFKFYPI